VNDKDQSVNYSDQNYKDQPAMLSRIDGLDLPERLWTDDNFTAAEEQPADSAMGLVSFAFIRAAIWRSAWLWCATAVVGLLIGFGLHMKFPPAHQASTSVLLTYGPYENINTAANDNQAIAQSRAVAGLAMHQLGLRQSASSFLAAYTVTVASNRVLMITASGPSTVDAVSRANAVASAFLRFRAGQLEAEQKLVLRSLNQQIIQTGQRINSINRQIRQLPAQPVSSAQQSQLTSLQTELNEANTALTTLEQTANGSHAGTATTLAVKGSEVLDAAVPVVHSRLKRLLLYPVTGLIVGLALGMGIVVVREVTSDRLRRRDDVAQALGVPVKLSVGAVRLNRWQPGKHGLAAARNANVRRIAAHLGSAAPTSSRGVAALAVVPVQDPQIAAVSLVSLAVTCAQQGKQVVVADLCAGAPAARLLGAKGPGVRTADMHGAHLVVAVPDRNDVLPAGPLERTSPQAQHSPFTEAVATACVAADLLLTLANLDPSLGGDHLATWATHAVVIVNVGRSSWTRIHAVGEMIRLSGTALVSAVLVGADKTDESLGVTPSPTVPAAPEAWG
jgi:capsular polysaccharide biosynthesis protein